MTINWEKWIQLAPFLQFFRALFYNILNFRKLKAKLRAKTLMQLLIRWYYLKVIPIRRVRLCLWAIFQWLKKAVSYKNLKKSTIIHISTFLYWTFLAHCEEYENAVAKDTINHLSFVGSDEDGENNEVSIEKIQFFYVKSYFD